MQGIGNQESGMVESGVRASALLAAKARLSAFPIPHSPSPIPGVPRGAK
jgi:hypothetical protein